MFMAGLKRCSPEMLKDYMKDKAFRMEEMNVYDTFPEYPFFICKIKK